MNQRNPDHSQKILSLTRCGKYISALSDIAAKAQRELFETKQKLQAAQARVTELEAALLAFIDGYKLETAARWGYSPEIVEGAPLVRLARRALETK